MTFERAVGAILGGAIGDAWGRPFRLVCPSRREGVAYDLSSDGPDGEPGGLDRIE
jgi:general secretion pathway protein G